MKKICVLFISIMMVFSISACGSSQTVESNEVEVEKTQESTEVPVESTEAPATPTEAPAVPEATPAIPTETPNTSIKTGEGFSIDVTGISTTDELETHIEEHLKSFTESLYSRWELLSVEIDTYEKYCDDLTKVSGFYETIIEETDQMCIMLFEYSAAYARMILDSDMSNEEKYKAIDGIKDCLYEDACDEIHDEIYEGILEEMNDYFYNGIIDDAHDAVDYDDWYDISSDEYSQWYDTSSEVYSIYYDAASDIYSFYYDMSGELYSGDIERAEKIYDKFLQKIDKAKGIGETNNSFSVTTFDTTIRTATSVEELETVVEAHSLECIEYLKAEWKALSEEIDTYDEYIENIDRIENFHTYLEDSAYQMLIMICEYGISYSELIMQSDSSSKDKYNDFDDMRECIYEDACDIINDEIYDDILEDIKDYYYEGVIKDAKDHVEYSEWSDARSDAYGWWSDARGEVYNSWSDFRGDIYSFYSDIRSELYGGDIEKANSVLQDFKDKVAKMK